MGIFLLHDLPLRIYIFSTITIKFNSHFLIDAVKMCTSIIGWCLFTARTSSIKLRGSLNIGLLLEYCIYREDITVKIHFPKPLSQISLVGKSVCYVPVSLGDERFWGKGKLRLSSDRR